MSSELSTTTKDTQEVYQLVRLDNTKVVEQWDVVEQVILNSFAHLKIDWTEGEKNELLQRIASDKIQSWGVYKEDKLIVFVTTCVIREFWGETKLLIYSLYGFEAVHLPAWHTLIKKMGEYAKGIGCNTIVAYTDNKRVLQIVKTFGAKIRSYIEMEI